MIKTFTPNELIRYIYGDTSKTEKDLIERDILYHMETYDEFNELVELKQSLDQVSIEPSNNVVRQIIDYSKSFEMPQISE